MKRQLTAFVLLGGIAKIAVASADLGHVKYGDQGPGTYCVTYLSTYLAPVSMGTELPEPSKNSTESDRTTSLSTGDEDRFSTDANPSLVTTLSPDQSSSALPSLVTILNPDQSSSASATEPTSVDFDPTGQRIIFAVTPSEETRKRDIGGFVGNDICTFATVFTLGNGRLFEGGTPISYLGDAFQLFQSSSAPSGNDITTTFSNSGGSLSFVNPGLPGSQASFCQTSADGEVYMTFTSRPQGCVPVRLTIYGVERCINGRIDGLDTSTAVFTQVESSQALELPSTDKPLPTSLPPPDVTDEETIFPTLTINPTRSLSSGNFTSRQSTVNIPSFTSGIVFPSLPPSRTDEPTSFETETLVPTFVGTSEEVQSSSEAETLALVSTSDLPVFESSSSLNELPTSSVSVSTSDGASSTLPLSSETSSLSDASDISSVFTTSFESTTQEPTTTTSVESTTTTTEDSIIITNAVDNGRFAMPNSNSDGGIMGFETEGDATHHVGDCFNEDDGTDDECVALKTSNDSKRNVGSFVGISQTLASLSPSRTALYTIQFYYAVITMGGSQACTIDAFFGSHQAYSQGLSPSGGTTTSWNRVLTTVKADSQSASLGISISCSGSGVATVYVDSVFVSDQVTPESIDAYQLGFGDDEGQA